ncbi:MAG: sigma 54-interacting transcriptional regulator [Oligoflexia bacterium]|nr:sigma 54-interacting transcriptional regulator [Oligoflexia bacterium]
MLAAQAESAPILIAGASGTGKGGIARWIHANGLRAGKPYLVATHDIPLTERLAQAQGGTLLIPEIGSWNLSDQRLLLNFLKTRSVPRAEGDAMPMLLNVRIIASTDQNLEGRAQGGLFNMDLLERLNGFRIEMPPLRERADEFEDIARGITSEITRELHKEHLRSLSPEAMTALHAYEWPGNLRELRNVLRLAVVSAKGDRIEAADLPEFGSERIDFRATRAQFEKIYLLELLKTYDWQIEKTCRMTRMDQPTLLSKMKQYGIEPGPTPLH